MRAVAERSPIGQRMSRRFVAGTTAPEAVAATRAINEAGMSVTIDHLGENVTNAEEARASALSYHQMLDSIGDHHLNANVSCKLTHLGFDVDEQLSANLVAEMVAHAARLGTFVRVDMEGSPYTQRTIDLVRKVARLAPVEEPVGCLVGGSSEEKRREAKAAARPRTDENRVVGTVIQSYLRRSEADVEQLCAEGIRIRLVKGAYKEPPSIAFVKKSEVDDSFIALMKIMLKSGLYHAIATHDERIIRATIAFAKSESIPPSAFEFQMLYGIRRDLQQKLVQDGWRMRVYLPFGTEWYPYFMRRLAERPANAWFLAKNILRA
jgi:proline dehydrogenase